LRTIVRLLPLLLWLSVPGARAGDWEARIGAGENAVREGRLSAAESAFRQALEIAERDAKPIQMARSREALADLYAGQGRADEAEPLYLDAIEHWRRILGSGQPRLGIPLHNLAVLYLRDCRVDEALPLVNEVAGLWTDTLGASHPDRVAALRSEAALLKRCGRDDHAARLEALASEAGR
jgi:tetratricopeptide (TPR) repeat protein